MDLDLKLAFGSVLKRRKDNLQSEYNGLQVTMWLPLVVQSESRCKQKVGTESTMQTQSRFTRRKVK